MFRKRKKAFEINGVGWKSFKINKQGGWNKHVLGWNFLENSGHESTSLLDLRKIDMREN